MKLTNNAKTRILSLTFIALLALGSKAYAQEVQTTNRLQTVEVSPTDGFKDLRNLIATQFNFTDSQMQQGLVKSEVTFAVSPTGTLTHINAEGECDYVNQELETVLSKLHYKMKLSNLTVDPALTTFKMPVELHIANR